MYKRLTVAVAALLFVAACNQDPTAVSSNELALAQNAQVITDNVVASPSSANNGMSCEGLFRPLLTHVDSLRTEANTALASGDSVTALSLNLRSIQILHRLVEHVRDNHRDHDEVADGEMEAVGE